MPEEEWIAPWARRFAACTDVAEARDLLDDFLGSTEVRDSFCDNCEERMPDEPMIDESRH
jgi:hypothetical protein